MSDEIYEKPSKSQRKRDDQSLQEMGERLVALSRERLAKIPLPDTLRQAVGEAQQIHAHGGRRRQLQYIGRLMRELDDPEPIRAALDLLDSGSALAIARQHGLEQWRTRLLEQGDAALEALIEQYPGADRQHLRQLIRQSQRETSQGKPPHAARAIFRYLSELVDAK
jgi:ribosome-associated protein